MISLLQVHHLQRRLPHPLRLPAFVSDLYYYPLPFTLDCSKHDNVTAFHDGLELSNLLPQVLLCDLSGRFTAGYRIAATKYTQRQMHGGILIQVRYFCPVCEFFAVVDESLLMGGNSLKLLKSQFEVENGVATSDSDGYRLGGQSFDEDLPLIVRVIFIGVKEYIDRFNIQHFKIDRITMNNRGGIIFLLYSSTVALAIS